MIINSNLNINEKELTELGVSVGDIQDSLTLPNPEYAAMMRFGKGRFYKKVSPTLCYLYKRDGNFVLPRFYFDDIPAIPFKDERAFGKEMSGKLKKGFSLRDYQKDFLSDVAITDGMLLEAACGSGKTVIGLYWALKIHKQTMVAVPTYYLAQQWKQRIEDFTTCECYIMTSTDKFVPLEADFVVVVLDLCTVRDFPTSFINSIGTVILDEAHRVGANTYIPLLDRFPAKHRIALTATFRRADGVHRILKYHFGKYFKMDSRFPKPAVYALATGVKIQSLCSKNKPYEVLQKYLDFHSIDYRETKSAIQFNGQEVQKILSTDSLPKTTRILLERRLNQSMEFSYTTMDSYLNEHSGRRKQVLSLLKACLESDRTVLFLSKRKDVLKTLHKYGKFQKYNPVLIISETNSRTEEEEDILQNKTRLVLGITQLAKEGMDIDRLDTLIIHLPMKDTEQAIGRIARILEGKKQPVVFYLLDDCPYTYAVFNNAQKFMKINADYKGIRKLGTINTVI